MVDHQFEQQHWWLQRLDRRLNELLRCRRAGGRFQSPVWQRGGVAPACPGVTVAVELENEVPPLRILVSNLAFGTVRVERRSPALLHLPRTSVIGARTLKSWCIVDRLQAGELITVGEQLQCITPESYGACVSNGCGLSTWEHGCF